MKKGRKRTYYYFDEQNDDFANNNIEKIKTPSDWDYYPQNIVFRVFKPIVYYFILFILWICTAVSPSLRVHNIKVLGKRKDRKKGFFIYGNHTTWFPDAVTAPILSSPVQCYTVCSPDAINIKGIRMLVKLLGAYPTPSDKISYKNYNENITRIYENGRSVSIYPEAHIWPKYNGIRDFSSVSFSYPAKLGAPCYAKTTVYIKKKNGHTKSRIYLDGPFYADEALSYKEAKEQLRLKVYTAMKKRTEEFSSALDSDYEYIKVDSPSEVRTEYVK